MRGRIINDRLQMTKPVAFLGAVLVILATYSFGVVALVFAGIAISFASIQHYAAFTHAVNPVLPTLIRVMLFAESACLLILVVGFFRSSWHVFRSPIWRVGRAEALLVALAILFVIVGSYILPHPPS